MLSTSGFLGPNKATSKPPLPVMSRISSMNSTSVFFGHTVLMLPARTYTAMSIEFDNSLTRF